MSYVQHRVTRTDPFTGTRRQMVIPRFAPGPRARYGTMGLFDFYGDEVATEGTPRAQKAKLEGVALGAGGALLLVGLGWLVLRAVR